MHRLHWVHEHHPCMVRTPLPYHPSTYLLREDLETPVLEAEDPAMARLCPWAHLLYLELDMEVC